MQQELLILAEVKVRWPICVVCVLPAGQDLTVTVEAKSGMCGMCHIQSGGQGVSMPTETGGAHCFSLGKMNPSVPGPRQFLASFILDFGGLPCCVNTLLRRL